MKEKGEICVNLYNPWDIKKIPQITQIYTDSLLFTLLKWAQYFMI